MQSKQPKAKAPPQSNAAQFMVCRVTEEELGQNEKTKTIVVHTTAVILIANPKQPMYHGPICNSCLVHFFHASSAMGSIYDAR
jgi:hypothetical protein